ncbi:MAG: flippase-like domain-containing protein [Bacteroidetes bacterium]|jgi:uncharacterized protein (TIRG00374 family)|nr:flippase-like domain-containing protein [Bacteroidota bacterium]
MPKSQFKSWIKILLPLLLGIFFVWFSFKDTTAEQRTAIWETTKNAKLFWVIISMVMGITSHVLRASRWKLLLLPLKDQPKLSNCFYTVMFGYLANLGIPRSGEVLRGASYASYTNLSFEQTFGTIITERIIDFIMLILIIGVTLVLKTDELLFYLDLNDIKPLHTLGYIFGFLGFIFLIFRAIKQSKNLIAIKINNFLTGLIQGIRSLMVMRHQWKFVFQTIAIWMLYIGMFWIIKYAIAGTENLSFGAALIGFIAGTFAMSVTSGGIGLYPFAISAVFKLFDIPVEVGQAFGWVLWIAQTIVVVVLGVTSAILLPIANKSDKLAN